MAKLLTMTLRLSSLMMTHGLHVRQGHVTNGLSEVGADADTAPASPEQAHTLFDLAGCIQRMPYLQYAAYTASSFCRAYLYSCNNLWSEELNSEVVEGTFCLINAYEQNTPEETRKQGFEKFHAFTSTVVEPFFNFLNEFFEYSDKKDMMGNKTLSDGMKLRELKDEPELCQQASDKLQCMIQIMKRKLSEVGTFKADLSKLSSNQALKLLSKVENVTSGLALFEEAHRVLIKKPEVKPLKGPLKTALGTESYTVLSLPYGHVGPISPDLRYPQDAVQIGLVMTKFDLSTVDPRAICNDGSPAIMYMKEHPTVKTKWHFHIDGGYFCFDKETCMDRAHQSTGLVSTKGFEDKKNNSGMWDPVMGGFPDYTHASAQYCSSDAWMGQIEVEDFEMVGGTTLSNGKPGTYFNGYFVLEAVMKKFLAMGMGSTPNQELFISGCSAGSIAATAMADSWAPRLQALGIQHNINIWTMLDGAPIVSPPGVGTFPSIYKMAMTLVDFLYKPSRNASASVFMNQRCAASNPTNVGTCVFPGTAVLYINTPSIVLNQLWDNFVLGRTYGFMHPMTSLAYNTGLVVVNQTRDVMKKVANHQNYWSISCGDHCISSNPNFWRNVPNTAHEKISARDMVLQTRDGALGRKPGMLGRVVVDECNHYNCGCVGQSTSMTKLAANSVFFKVMARLAPGISPMKFIPSTIPFTTMIASDTLNLSP